MATEKLYEQNPYLRQMVAKVTASHPYKDGLFASSVERTVFYPEGGGQPSDTGVLGGQKVSYVFIRDEEVWHVTPAPLPVGKEVIGYINWARRFDFMQQHTGEHIMTGQCLALYGANNVGFHLTENTVILDVDKELSENQLKAVELRANQAIWKNAPVTAATPSVAELDHMRFRSKPERVHGGDLRIVTVSGYDTCACCGTHVSSAGQVGIAKILDFQKYKGGTRMYMAAGRRALADYNQKQQELYAVSRELSAKPLETAAAVQRLQGENAQWKCLHADATNQLFEAKAAGLPAEPFGLAYVQEGLATEDMRRFALALAERTEGIAAVLSPLAEGGTRYALASRTQDMPAYVKEFNKTLAGRGGGKDSLVQGSCEADLEQVLAFLRKER